MKFDDLVTYALNIFLLDFVSTAFHFVLLSPVATPSYFPPDLLPFPLFVIFLNIPCFRLCLHILPTVSESLFHKCAVQLTSISMFWCSPGIEFSFRLFKPYAGDIKAIYFTVNDRLPLWHLLPSTCGPKIFRYGLFPSTLFQSPIMIVFNSPLPLSARISWTMPYSPVTSSSS